MNSEETYSEKAKKNNRSEQRFDYQNGSQPNLRAYDNEISRSMQEKNLENTPGYQKAKDNRFQISNRNNFVQNQYPS